VQRVLRRHVSAEQEVYLMLSAQISK
jgi:hypothetical protein